MCYQASKIKAMTMPNLNNLPTLEEINSRNEIWLYNTISEEQTRNAIAYAEQIKAEYYSFKKEVK